MKCIGCISLRSSSSPSRSRIYEYSYTSHRAFVCSTLPLLWDSCPSGSPGLSPSVSLSLFRSRRLLALLLHRSLPSLDHARQSRSFVVPSLLGSLLYRRCAPTIASGESTGERVATSLRRSCIGLLDVRTSQSLVLRCSESHCTRRMRVSFMISRPRDSNEYITAPLCQKANCPMIERAIGKCGSIHPLIEP